jgi:hypothetical protein
VEHDISSPSDNGSGAQSRIFGAVSCGLGQPSRIRTQGDKKFVELLELLSKPPVLGGIERLLAEPPDSFECINRLDGSPLPLKNAAFLCSLAIQGMNQSKYNA